MTNNNRQAFVAAFTFGLVAYAGTSGLFLFLNKRASKIIRDAPRLALIAFLISSALWAQIDFFALLLNLDSMTGCQIMVTFASTFDQFARVSIQQSLLWIFSTHSLASLTEIAIMQGFIVLRLILGGVFVGIQRPQLDTVCLTQTSILPVGITVSVVDTAFVAFLLIRIISRGVYSDTQRGAISPRQSRAVALVVMGLVIWTGASAPLMLSIQPMSIFVRTTVPSVALLVLIGILTLFQGRLFSNNTKHIQPTDVTDFDASRDFNTRQMTDSYIHRSSSYNDFVRTSAADFTRPSNPMPAPAEPKRELPLIMMPAVGQANIGMGGVPVLGQLFPLPKTQSQSASMEPESSQRQNSHQATLSTSSSGSRSNAKISTSDQENWEASAKLAEPQHSPPPAEHTVAGTTSAFLSPGMDEVRRRSPRQSPRQLPSPALSIFPRSTPTRLQARTPTKPAGDTVVNFSLPVDARVPRPNQSTLHQPSKSAPLAVIPRSNANEILSKREDSARTLSVVHRPRPIPRKSNFDRALFPAEGSPNLKNHKRSLSCGSVRFKQSLDTEVAEINYDLSRLNEFANVLHANIPTPSETNRSTRRRSRSMVELPILSADLKLKSKSNEAKPRIDKTDALTPTSRTPASPILGETTAQFPKTPQPPIPHAHEEPIFPASPRWRDPHAKGYGRRSSPILPIEDLSALTPSPTRDEDFAVDAAIQSPAMQIHLQRALTVTVTAKCQQRSGLGVAEAPLMLRDESPQAPLPLAVHKLPTNANVVPGSELRQRAEDVHVTAKQHFWPSQVGKARPATFTDRAYSTKSRRGLPPAPLLFRRTDNFYAEPSPVESEEDMVESAHKSIQVDSPNFSYQPAENDRLALLTNLENELNEQEHQWQTIRHTMLARDSMSTVGTSPSRDSRYGYGSARMSKLAQQRGQLDAEYDVLGLFPQADMMPKTKLAAGSTFPRFTTSLATPTPPDTDEESEYDEDHEALIGQAQVSPAKAAMALWHPVAAAHTVTSASIAPSLWTPALGLEKEIASVEIPGTSIREPVRKDLKPLMIESSRLWEKPQSKTEGSNHGLWQPLSQVKTQVVEAKVQQSKPPRNPPRRIRRVTMLPDILESPKPLPDRRGTLGIFQFPWGDQSDCATITARPLAPMFMPPAVDGGVQMQCSGSVFDMEDYEQDDGEYYDSSETYDSDDEECFELAQLVAQPTDSYLHDAPLRKMSTSHEDELTFRSLPISEETKDTGLLKRCETLEAVPCVIHGSGNDSDDKANDRTSVRTQTQTQVKYDEDGDADSESETPRAGNYSAKAVPPTSTTTTTRAMTLTDMDLREQVSEKNRIRVRRQPQFGGRVTSISMAVPQMARCLMMDMGQDSAGAPINSDNGTHGTPKSILDPCSDREPKSHGAPGAGHPQQHQQATLLFRFLEDSISKPANLKLDYDSPSPLPLNPLVIYKSETPTGGRQILVINLLYPPSNPAQSPPQQTTTIYPSSSMALWTPSTPVSRPSKGLPQPDDSTWSTYIPSGEAARLLPVNADMPSIESNSLWTAPVKKAALNNFGLWGTKQPLPGMWTQSPINTKISYGLPQPDAETWATYLIVEDDATRVKPREAEPASVDGTSLWTAAKPVISETVSEDGLWSRTSSAASVSGAEPFAPSETETAVVNFGLWEPLPAIASTDEEPIGLFSLSHRRTDYRTTKLTPAALGMERSPRRALDAFPDFGFTHLWNMAPLWDSKANSAAVKLQREIDSLVLEGLFSLNHRRNNFRTTSESPAALETRPKQRISQQSLPKLNSDSLWSVRASNKDVSEVNWLALSTIRPRTASVVSLTDSESVASDVPALTRASSIKSETSRPAATPTEWLAALDEAIRLGSGKTLDMDTDSNNYQLWSKSGAAIDEPVIASDELWKPSTARFLELTPTLSEFDKQHIESGTSQRGRTQKARPPMPLYPGASSSAFLPGASDTPRDFSAQGLWARSQSPAPGAKEDGSWIDKSLRKGLSFVQLW
ncbi:hypothetical protein F53441_2169 [Fusarium austroafricanum]|uniref:Uncharacterized protein n=1 Tax=Fusarium austroafricanum TaxID=2364996 RepID=A0A8H4KT05_9HYPO|nr:hypothetical protein F53441_2169 [Fusarium austroafricanum]